MSLTSQLGQKPDERRLENRRRESGDTENRQINGKKQKGVGKGCGEQKDGGGGSKIKTQFSSVAQSCLTLCDPMDYMASLSITNSQSVLKLMSIECVMPSNHPILCCLLLLLPSIFPSIRVFSNELVLRIRWTKYFEFQLQHQSFQWTFRTDFL